MDILLVDDQEISRGTLAEFLDGLLGYNVVQCDDGVKALKEVEKKSFDLVLTDIRMPNMNGLELLERIKNSDKTKHIPVVLFTGFAEIDTAVKALRLGAYDYLLKPININRLNELIDELSNKKPINDKSNQPPIPRIFRKGGIHEVPGIGRIGVFSKAQSEIMQMAYTYSSDRSVPVLIEGETGTGKEIIATIIHHGESFNHNPFISINCSAISPTLFESELFGYEGGSFTGAKSKGMQGKFELANGGTLFLDEVGEMPLDLQPKLLRAIQEKAIFRVGASKKVDLDVRIVAATNRNLVELVEKGLFREDLYHRINTGKINTIPLRIQKEAIAPLAQMIMLEMANKRKKEFRAISPEAVAILESYAWTGNIRELINVIDRVVLLYDAPEIMPSHLDFISKVFTDKSSSGFILSPESNFVLPENELDLEKLERVIVQKALTKFDGNKTKTADYLKTTRSALRSKL